MKFLKKRAHTTAIESNLIVLFTILTAMHSISSFFCTDAQAQNAVITLDEFLKYKAILDAEAEKYRGFIQTSSLWGGGAFTTFMGILGWMNWKSRDDVRKEVQRQLGEIVKAEVERQSPQIQAEIRKSVSDFEVSLDKQKSNITSIMDDIQAQKESVLKLRDDLEKRKVQVDRIVVELSGTVNTIANKDSLDPSVDGMPSSGSISVYQGKIKGLKVLWVDDVPINNEYQSSVLKTLGAEITTALDTEGAILLLDNQKFDLVISDMGRSGNYTAGLDMLDTLKNRGIKAPVIFYCSPATELDLKTKVLENGAFAITSNATGLFGAIINFIAKRQ